MSKNIIYIDIGSHHGQEIKSFTDTNYFLFKIAKRIIKNILQKKIKKIVFDLPYFHKLFKSHLELKKLNKNMKIIMVEPNIDHLKRKVYKKATLVIPLAIGDTQSNDLEICKLYTTDNIHFTQAFSIYRYEINLNSDKFLNILSLNPNIFAKLIQTLITDKKQKIIIRANCEGSENSIIYAFKKVFPNNFNTILGSLKDVGEAKGEKEYKNLINYIEQEKMNFSKFTSNIDTWLISHQMLIKEIQAAN